MGFVIGQACIGVKDTACVDACPTDAIHSKEGANQYYIDPVACIDCAACEPVCPVKAIYPGDQVPEAEKKFIAINTDFFKGFDKSTSTSYTRKKKEGETAVVPAATTAGAVSETAGAEWKEVEGWETAWAAHRGEYVDPTEVQKRYGRVRSLIEEEGQYTLRLFLPEKVPDHMFRFKYGLPEEMSGYDVTGEVVDNILIVKGKISNPAIARLSGHANSFPDCFYVEYPLPSKLGSVSVKKVSTHVVDVIVMKENEKAAA